MKKGLVFIFIILLITFSAACGNEKKVVTKDVPKVEQTPPENQVEIEGSENAEPKKLKVGIYYGNEEASAFVKEEIEVDVVSPEILLQHLSAKGVVPVDVQVLSFREMTKENSNVIELNLSKEFNTYLNTLGTAGEYITIGGITNTFLAAYDSEKIHITADGEMLSTGHAEYPGYMSEFK